MTELVFVYGTLKRGHYNHGWLKAAKFICVGKLGQNGWKMYNLGQFPAIIPTSDVAPPVIGEVYEVDEETLFGLDLLEGYPSHYSRRMVGVQNSVGETFKAWVYFMDCVLEDSQQILSGEW